MSQKCDGSSHMYQFLDSIHPNLYCASKLTLLAGEGFPLATCKIGVEAIPPCPPPPSLAAAAVASNGATCYTPCLQGRG